MSDTTTIVQSERKFAESLGYLDGAGPEVRVHIHFMCDALEQQAAQIEALRADAERLTTALNKIAERQNSDWPDRCQALVNIARAALRGKP